MTTPLCTLADIRRSLGIATADTSKDAELEALIVEVSAAMEERMDRTIGLATYTEVLQGNNNQYLTLKNRPVQSITSLYLDQRAFWGDAPGAFNASTLLVEGIDYALKRDRPDNSSRSGLIANIGGYWPAPIVRQQGLLSPSVGQTGNVKVTYVAGFATVPPDLARGCKLVIANVLRISKLGAPVQSESLGAYSYSVLNWHKDDWLAPARYIMARYQDVGFVG